MADSYSVQMGARQSKVIEALAKETNRSVEEVEEIYTMELRRLQSGARIQDYLVVLTCKKVRDHLRETSGPLDRWIHSMAP